MDPMRNDSFRNRGAVEQESPEQQGNLNFRGQIGHRNKSPLIGSLDTDFPEPGENPEHTGEVIMAANADKAGTRDRNTQPQDQEEDIRDEVDQDPGMHQKENQNEQKDDPLAA